MSYTVKKLARISGVSPRTLRFYDEIGLLKPAFYGDNQYRYYEEEQLLLLQQILFYRELGLPLNDIQGIIQSNDFNKIEALQSHRKILEGGLEKAQQLIKTIDKTIAHLRGELKMCDEELFDALKYRESEPAKQYEGYLIERGILSKDQLDESWQKVKHWGKSDWEAFQRQGDDFYKAMVVALKNQLLPSSPEVQALMRGHYELIHVFWPFDQENYCGLALLYREHPDFRKFFDLFDPRLVDFLTEAMTVYAKRELS